jgi:hypothetical protein
LPQRAPKGLRRTHAALHQEPSLAGDAQCLMI